MRLDKPRFDFLTLGVSGEFGNGQEINESVGPHVWNGNAESNKISNKRSYTRTRTLYLEAVKQVSWEDVNAVEPLRVVVLGDFSALLSELESVRPGFSHKNLDKSTHLSKVQFPSGSIWKWCLSHGRRGGLNEFVHVKYLRTVSRVDRAPNTCLLLLMRLRNLPCPSGEWGMWMGLCYN